MATHYERLGVRPDAGADEIRAAYRRRARELHPDARGAAGAPGGGMRAGDAGDDMAALNAAWWVLRDPGRRAMYDADLRAARPVSHGSARTGSSGASGRTTGQASGRATGADVPSGRRSGAGEADTARTDTTRTDTARRIRGLPWVLLLVVFAALFVFSAFARSGSSPGDTDIDNLLSPGSCLVVPGNGLATEAPCSGDHDAVVERLVPFDFPCPVSLFEVRVMGATARVCARRV
jgi:hypothetical protein